MEDIRRIKFIRSMVLANVPYARLVDQARLQEQLWNPGGLFPEVHVVLTENGLVADNIDKKLLQPLVGSANLEVHVLPQPNSKLLDNFGFSPRLMRRWGRKAVKLAKNIQPQLVICMDYGLHASLAVRILKRLRIPYVLSLRRNPDDFVRPKRRLTWRSVQHWIQKRASRRLEKLAVKMAKHVLYNGASFQRYIAKSKAKAASLVYTQPLKITKKKSHYGPVKSPKLVMVSPLNVFRNPEAVIRGIAQYNGAKLDIYGEGPLKESMQKLVDLLEVQDRVRIQPPLPATDYLEVLPTYDAMIVHNEYSVLPVAVREAMLAGVPVIINHRVGPPVPELSGEVAEVVEATADGYYRGMVQMFNDQLQAETLAKSAAEVASAWTPESVQAAQAEIIQRVVEGQHNIYFVDFLRQSGGQG